MQDKLLSIRQFYVSASRRSIWDDLIDHSPQPVACNITRPAHSYDRLLVSQRERNRAFGAQAATLEAAVVSRFTGRLPSQRIDPIQQGADFA